MIRYNLIDYMSEQCMSVYKLSKYSGVSATYIYNIVHGRMENPSIGITEKLACALGVELNDLLK